MPDPIVIATWKFGATAARVALPLLEAGSSALDAALAGGQAVEDDPDVDSVGFGGLANAIGVVQLDACVMDGKTLSCAGVAGVENIKHVAALARRVMEKTPHVLLVGEGARQFAIKEGFPLEPLQTPESVKKWQDLRDKARKQGALGLPPSPGVVTAHLGLPPESHDTVTVLALDSRGNLGGVCTTSGLALKMHGRVGDSPLIGSGLYVDNDAGAAGATGVGEEVIRIGASLFMAETMRAGKSAQETCELAVRRLNAAAVRRGVHPARVAFLAIDPKGNPGAACTSGTDFHYAVGRKGKVEILKAPEFAIDKG
ncbi:MAG: isoaspartyl peptidase/L-asparaginase [Gemmataceae bacterium]